MQRILIVDDEPALCKTVERFLNREGYSTYCAGNGQQMRQIMSETSINLVLLDIRLPGEDGLTLALELRKHSNIPIIMLTSKDDVIDRIVGLESGADDYVSKPFHSRELLARIRSVLRRTDMATSAVVNENSGGSMLLFADWRLNLDTHQLFSPNGNEVLLSPAEYNLLCVFLQHSNRVLNRDFLLDQVQGHVVESSDRSIDVHISHLRKKIEPNPKLPTLIKTIRSAGYLLTTKVTRS